MSSSSSRTTRSTPIPNLLPHPDSVLDNATWLLRLRWVAIGGQLATIALVVGVWRVALRVEPLLVVIALTAVTNLLFHLWLRGQRTAGGSVPDSGVLDSGVPAGSNSECGIPECSVPECSVPECSVPECGIFAGSVAGEGVAGDRALGERAVGERGAIILVLTMLLDLFSLTALLYFSGGPTNPFTTFYLVNLALAAILLPSRWSWVLTGLAVLLFVGFFFWGYYPIPELEGETSIRSVGRPWVRQQGLMAAFAACAVVNCYFITRVSRELQQRESELRRVEKQRAASERLEALATLAAGAGHELASPLSTIAVIANDLARHLEGASVPASVIDDMSLIRSELAHCRSILDRMSGNAGQAVGEQVGSWAIARILGDVVTGLRRSERVRVVGLDQVGEIELFSPLQGLSQALRGLVQNGLDASQETESEVIIRVSATDDEVQITVTDQGEGMSPQQLARAGEPFFTTKEPGQGMGLGLFLTRNVIERLGGTLAMESRMGQGTTADVRLPITTH